MDNHPPSPNNVNEKEREDARKRQDKDDVNMQKQQKRAFDRAYDNKDVASTSKPNLKK